ncbi:hypothetical protein N9W40_02120, partial [Flavobacteriales bacterium]|nr:hypothetical protein [Flavobacteriales bacterium]
MGERIEIPFQIYSQNDSGAFYKFDKRTTFYNQMKHLLIALLTLVLIGCTSEPKVKKTKNP